MEPDDRSALHIGGAVVTVRDLSRSQEFYCEVLGLTVEVSSTDAVLLSGGAGTRLVLRELPRAPQVMGGVGVHYVAWIADDPEALTRVKQALERRDALAGASSDGDVELVEGRDPDGIPVIVACPRMPGPGLTELPDRIYRY